MTKKHFIALANALKPEYDAGRLPEAVIDALCNFMRSQNPAFMAGRWTAYLKGECGPNGGEIKTKI